METILLCILAMILTFIIYIIIQQEYKEEYNGVILYDKIKRKRELNKKIKK